MKSSWSWILDILSLLHTFQWISSHHLSAHCDRTWTVTYHYYVHKTILNTRMHSSRMRTACLLTISRSIPRGRSARPWMQTPLPCRPLLDAKSPMQTPPPGCRPLPTMQTTLWMQNTPYPQMQTLPPWEQTDKCKNITLPQTSFTEPTFTFHHQRTYLWNSWSTSRESHLYHFY